jgi:hypothetical protein
MLYRFSIDGDLIRNSMAYFGTCHEGTAAGITVDGSAETETAAVQRRELVAAITKDVRLSHLRCIDQWQPPQLWSSEDLIPGERSA